MLKRQVLTGKEKELHSGSWSPEKVDSCPKTNTRFLPGPEVFKGV